MQTVRTAFASILVILLAGGCRPDPIALAAADELTCVSRSRGVPYCFGDAKEHAEPTELTAEFAGARLVVGASVCGVEPSGEVHCLGRWPDRASVRREPFAEILEDWVLLQSERLPDLPDGSPGPLRACGRSTGDVVCGDLDGTATGGRLRPVETRARTGFVRHGFDICGLTDDATVECFDSLHDDSSGRGDAGARRLFGGDYWMCVEYANGAVECYSRRSGRGPSAPPLARWTMPTKGRAISSIESGWLEEICARYESGDLECFGMTRDDRGEPHATLIDERPARVKSLASGDDTLCAITMDDALMCWRAGATKENKPDELPREPPTP